MGIDIRRLQVLIGFGKLSHRTLMMVAEPAEASTIATYRHIISSIASGPGPPGCTGDNNTFFVCSHTGAAFPNIAAPGRICDRESKR